MSEWQHKRRYVLVFFAASLCSTVLLKFGEIQYLEWIFALDFLVLIWLFAWNGLRAKLYRPFLSIGLSYGIFLTCALILSFFALDQQFISFNGSLLKKPVLVTVARIGEMFLDVCYMLYLATLFRDDKNICRFGAKTYYWTGIAGCIYSFVTFPLNVAFDLQLGTYADIHRFRGFNNEGGGFGTYLVSVGVLAVVMYRRGWLSRNQFRIGIVTIFIGLVGSKSKSAFFAAGLLGLIELMWFSRGWRRWALIGGMCLALAVAGSLLDFQAAIEGYVLGSQSYQATSNLHATDPSYVAGRVAGAVLAPRMIAARPLLGIGWGNYPLVRDDPNYRQGTAFALGSVDSPGLGVVDYMVELGIPLWIYLTWIQLKPVFMLRRVGSDPWIVCLALVLPVSTWAGAHLNLIHPWIVVAFALGLGYEKARTDVSPDKVTSI